MTDETPPKSNIIHLFDQPAPDDGRMETLDEWIASLEPDKVIPPEPKEPEPINRPIGKIVNMVLYGVQQVKRGNPLFHEMHFLTNIIAMCDTLQGKGVVLYCEETGELITSYINGVMEDLSSPHPDEP